MYARNDCVQGLFQRAMSKLIGYNTLLDKQVIELVSLIKKNPILTHLLEDSQARSAISIQDWYVGAGCIAQTVWNQAHGFTLDAHIKDIDLVYYDDTDLSEKTEKEHEAIINQALDLPIPVDCTNEARVHTWYEDRFGYPIKAYQSAEEAINTWPTTATSVAVKIDSNGELQVYAPFGLNDLFGLIIRPNKVQITREIYEKKVQRWQLHWPRLTIINWNN